MTDLVWLFPTEPRSPNIRWEWPMAIYRGQLAKHAAYLACEVPYHSRYIKISDHGPIGVVILRYNILINGNAGGKPHRMLSDLRFLTLRDAIEFAEQWIKTHPDWHPRII